MSYTCLICSVCDSGSNMLLNYSPSRKLIITVMVSKDPNECCLSVLKQHHSIVALCALVLWQLFDSQRMESIIMNTRLKIQGKSFLQKHGQENSLLSRETKIVARDFIRYLLAFFPYSRHALSQLGLCASVCVWTSVPNDVRCTPLSRLTRGNYPSH